MKDTNPLIVTALAFSLVLAGCVGSGDDDLQANAADADLTISIEADGAGEVSHLGLELDRVLAHDANVSLPDGFHEVSLGTDHADAIVDGAAGTVEVASGSVPAGSYDQILLRLANATVETSADGHDHDEEGDHEHGDAAVSTGAMDLPLNVSFEATSEEPTHVRLVLDVAESFDGDSLAPSFASAEVVRGEETLSTQTDLDTRASSGSEVPRDPPAARLAVFAPNGDQIHEPAFDPEDGLFVNSISSGFPVGEDVRFSATDSDPVADGAAIESYEWSLGDGTETTGLTASHSYEKPGVYEVTLTVTDSYGNEADHAVRIVTVGWTQTVVETSFEEGSEWSPSSAETSLNEWQLMGPGHNSSTAWHIGLPGEAQNNQTSIGYAPTTEPVSLISPEYEVPEDFELAGYELFVDGHASSGQLELLLHIDDETRTLGTVSDEVEWEQLGSRDALSDATGSTVQFEVSFTSPVDALRIPEGPAYAIDDFTLAGMPGDDMVNPDLLDQSGGDGHDGHDHEH